MLARIFYAVRENVGLVELCVNVLSPTIDCPITIPFQVVFSTRDGTAGNAII